MIPLSDNAYFRLLAQPVRQVKGIGEQHAQRLHAYVARKHKRPERRAKIKDLLCHVPYDYVDRREISLLAEAREGVRTLRVRVVEHRAAGYRSRGGKAAPHRVQCEDATGAVTLLFFRGDARYITKQLPIGEEVLVSGTLQHHHGAWQMTHPDLIVPVADYALICRIDPIYPTMEGVSSRMWSRWIEAALDILPPSGEWLAPSTVERYGWPSQDNALKFLHRPQEKTDVNQALSRLAFDEAFAHQLSLQLLRAHQQRSPAVTFSLLSNPDVTRMLSALPFKLTDGQIDVLRDIDMDVARPERMLRLLQGDVGSGKTVVALLVMLAAARSGYQAALMAPTEILARQHMQTIDALCGVLDIPVIFLAGSLTQKQRALTRERIAAEPSALIIGTHALFQEGVSFSRLALVVIDEQHKFGVAQRLALSDKGVLGEAMAPHMLLMTATPIPRSLAIAQYGDMDISQLRQKPAGRQAIDTRVVSMSRIRDVLDGVQRALNEGEKLYWICPHVEAEQHTSDTDMHTRAAVERYDALNLLFPGKVGLVHGRMPMKEREPVMQAFLRGDITLLVATTVVEVGVNVPDATIMVIEHAQQFGLAQLHQLRGRVGRGERASRCVLLYDEQCSATAKARLKIMRDTNDGFEIAEADLNIRGYGDMLGTRQTGLPDFTFFNMEQHYKMMAPARKEAQLALHQDTNLSTTRGQMLHGLLDFYGLEDAVKYMRSG